MRTSPRIFTILVSSAAVLLFSACAQNPGIRQTANATSGGASTATLSKQQLAQRLMDCWVFFEFANNTAIEKAKTAEEKAKRESYREKMRQFTVISTAHIFPGYEAFTAATQAAEQRMKQAMVNAVQASRQDKQAVDTYVNEQIDTCKALHNSNQATEAFAEGLLYLQQQKQKP